MFNFYSFPKLSGFQLFLEGAQLILGHLLIPFCESVTPYNEYVSSSTCVFAWSLTCTLLHTRKYALRCLSGNTP